MIAGTAAVCIRSGCTGHRHLTSTARFGGLFYGATMSNVVAMPDGLEARASRINMYHRRAEKAHGECLDNMIACGRELNEAKHECEVQGIRWGAWVRDNLEFNRRQAQKYRNVSTITSEEKTKIGQSTAQKSLDVLESEIINLRRIERREIPDDDEDDQRYCTIDNLHSLVDAGRKFGTTYADPPWSYSNNATRNAARKQYATMSMDEIKSLPVPDLAKDNAHLHLWATVPLIADALDLMQYWGYRYVSMLTWCKPRIGMGNYYRVNTEHLLLGIKGKQRFPEEHRNIGTWMKLKNTRHSEKPGEIRQMIENISPAGRLELFGRKAHPGWTVWGNEIERDLFFNDQSVQ